MKDKDHLRGILLIAIYEVCKAPDVYKKSTPVLFEALKILNEYNEEVRRKIMGEELEGLSRELYDLLVEMVHEDLGLIAQGNWGTEKYSAAYPHYNECGLSEELYEAIENHLKEINNET